MLFLHPNSSIHEVFRIETFAAKENTLASIRRQAGI
jgi:hypothetical protein